MISELFPALSHELRSRISGTLKSLFGFGVLWELCGRVGPLLTEIGWTNIVEKTLPPLSVVFVQGWIGRHELLAHIPPTISVAAAGFLLGNVIGILLAVLFELSTPAERLLDGLATAIFSMPLIILVLLVDGSLVDRESAAVLFTALAVFYPTLRATLVGFRDADSSLLSVVEVAGGRGLSKFVKVRTWSALPGIFAGFKIAAPIAFLGAMLSEFTGAEKGLGKYVLGLLGQAAPERLWAVAVVVTVLASLAYGVFSLLGNLVAGFTTTEKLRSTFSADRKRRGQNETGTSRAMWFVLGRLVVPIVGWALYAWLFRGLLCAKSPGDVFEYLQRASSEVGPVLQISQAAPRTLGIALLGVVVSLVVSFVFASILSVNRAAGDLVLPIMLITQTVPIIVWIPLLKIVFGADLLILIAVTVFATFFPSFAIIYRGFSLVPRDLVAVSQVYNASRLDLLKLLRFPSAVPYVATAMKLVAPRALLGVILAEYFVTADGIGGLLYRARGYTDFSMIWSLGAVTVVFSAILYSLSDGLEAILLSRFRPELD